jgi:hypothetical protein
MLRDARSSDGGTSGLCSHVLFYGWQQKARSIGDRHKRHSAIDGKYADAPARAVESISLHIILLRKKPDTAHNFVVRHLCPASDAASRSNSRTGMRIVPLSSRPLQRMCQHALPSVKSTCKPA